MKFYEGFFGIEMEGSYLFVPERVFLVHDYNNDLFFCVHDQGKSSDIEKILKKSENLTLSLGGKKYFFKGNRKTKVEKEKIDRLSQSFSSNPNLSLFYPEVNEFFNNLYFKDYLFSLANNN